MKSEPNPVTARFHAVIGKGGVILVPEPFASRFAAGQEIEVRLAPSRRPGSPFAPELDEDEVSEIAALQAEPAENIRGCLRAQGVLSGKAPGTRPRRDAGRPKGARGNTARRTARR